MQPIDPDQIARIEEAIAHGETCCTRLFLLIARRQAYSLQCHEAEDLLATFERCLTNLQIQRRRLMSLSSISS